MVAMNAEQLQERLAAVEKQRDDALLQYHAAYKEATELREHNKLLQDFIREAVSACAWMAEDKSLGLTIGDSLTTDGVAALRRQRDELVKKNKRLRAEINRSG